jgi:hypothetical protein
MVLDDQSTRLEHRVARFTPYVARSNLIGNTIDDLSGEPMFDDVDNGPVFDTSTDGMEDTPMLDTKPVPDRTAATEIMFAMTEFDTKLIMFDHEISDPFTAHQCRR